jgi:HK97 gp10 family phage protein
MSGIDVRVQVHKNNIPAVIRAVETHDDNAVRGFADAVKDRAQANAPVLTGRLREGITVSGGGASYQITASSLDGGAEREYAAYNEFGTRNMHAQPFMKPGFEEAKASSLPTQLAEYIAAIESAAE